MKLKKVLCVFLAFCMPMVSGCVKKPSVNIGENETIKEGGNFIGVMLGDSYIEEWNENNVISNVSWDKLKLSEDDEEKFPKLKKTFDKLNTDALKDAQSLMYELSSVAEMSEGDEYNPLYLEGETKIFMQRADENLVSYLEEVYIFSGGAHPEYQYTGSNFNPKTGEELSIGDVITNAGELPKILSEKICGKYDYVNFGENQPLGTFMEYSPEDYQWTMDYQGVTFWFSPYDIAAYMVGPLSTKIYFDEFPELFNEKYTRETFKDYVVSVPLGQSVDFDLISGDGKTDTLYIYEMVDSFGGYNMLSVTVNDLTSVDEINYAYDFDVYLAHIGDKNYIYSDSSSDNDYHMFCIWDINGNIPEEIKVLYGTEIDYEYIEEGVEEGVVYKQVFNNPYDFKLETRFEILGTRGATATFKIGEDGTPEMIDEAYTFNYGHDVKTAIVLKVKLIPSMEMSELPVGTNLVPYQTDGETYVDLNTENGQTVRLEIDTSEYPVKVNGIYEDECFEEILYAG